MKNSKAFTLTEVLVSLVVVVVVSAASWMAVSVLSPTAQVTRHRILAENLITKSQEEVIRIAQDRFDTLEACTSPTMNTCGFSDISTQFSEFTRALDVTSEGTTELKRAHIIVRWQEFGETKTLDSIILLARPPEPLPGNVIGMVRDKTTNAILGNVQLTITSTGGANNSTTFSSNQVLARPDNKQVNFTFAEPNTGRFILPVGNWRLTAKRSGYVDFTYPQDIIISSNEEEEISFSMTAKPTDAHISGKLLDALTAVQLGFSSQSQINLYDDGNRQQQATGTGSFNFTIPFNNSNKQCFTLATKNAYKSGYAGNFACTFPFQADGWSSAVVGANTINCSNAWNGNATTDRLCVNPGDNLTQNIPLVKVPTAIVKGIVRDKAGNPIKGADVRVRWHDNTLWPSAPVGKTDSTGYYEVVVPAEQGLFPNSSGFYAQWWAEANAPFIQCCTEPSTVLKFSPTMRAPFFPGNVITQDITVDISPNTQDCGNAQGNVKDDKTGASISSASVGMSGYGQTTNGSGDYIFQCTTAALGFRLPVGATDVTASKNNYYSFTTAGNTWYAARGAVTVVKLVSIPVSDIGLWPKGFGTVTGTVRNAGNNLPIPGISVFINLGTGGSLSAVTDSSGRFTVNNVPETWPPPSLVGNKKYQQAVRNHSVDISQTELYESYTSGPFTLTAGQSKNFDIKLIPRGSF